jgi:type IV pilus assembly protein PilW
MKNQAMRAQRRSSSRGFSLVELMVSVTIGLVVVLTVLAAFVGSGVGGRHGSALGQATEDASLALNILRGQVAMAGYAEPYSTNVATGKMLLVYGGTAIFGCDGGFEDPAAVGEAAVTCKADAAQPDAFTVLYQADKSNAIANGAVPYDCQGNALPLTAAAGPVPAHYVNESRFYISANGELMCKGNSAASASAVALVSNIQDLRLTYGLANGTTPNQVTRYVDGTTIGSAKTSWANVVSVRICVVVRSENPVSDMPTSYYNCEGTSVAAPDRRMYRAFTTTVVLHNRLGGI